MRVFNLSYMHKAIKMNAQLHVATGHIRMFIVAVMWLTPG